MLKPSPAFCAAIASLAVFLTPLTANTPVFAAGAAASSPVPRADAQGIVKLRSRYGHDETVARLKSDIEGKGIRFFDLIEQSKLAAAAGVELRPSSLLIFGNPPLGTLFIKASPLAGLDWPVRVLVFTDDKGQVWVAYTDFAAIAKRHRIKNREPFQQATGVIGSIMSSVPQQAARGATSATAAR